LFWHGTLTMSTIITVCVTFFKFTNTLWDFKTSTAASITIHSSCYYWSAYFSTLLIHSIWFSLVSISSLFRTLSSIWTVCCCINYILLIYVYGINT
jgi:hypothetical protein